jgi:hypothetical protein
LEQVRTGLIGWELEGPIEIGNTTGRHFSEDIMNRYCLTILLMLHREGARELSFWYDQEDDFYHMSGHVWCQQFNIRYRYCYVLHLNGKHSAVKTECTPHMLAAIIVTRAINLFAIEMVKVYRKGRGLAGKQLYEL